MGTINILCDTYEEISEANFSDFNPQSAHVDGIEGNNFSLPKIQLPTNRVKTTKIESANADELKQKITDQVLSIIPAIDKEVIKNNGFELTEMEINIGFKLEAGFAVPCLVSAGASTNTSITFKIKKKGS